MNYQLELLVDDDFDASNLRGITFINSNTAIVDEVIFKDKMFYKPILEIVKYDLLKIKKKVLLEICQKLYSDIKIEERHNGCYYDIIFGKNNPYDLDKIVLDNSSINTKRVLVKYKHCPVNSFYIIQKDKNSVFINVSPFTKNYFTISDSEWWQFVNYLDENYDIQKVREEKLNWILKEETDNISNLIRQIKFIIDNEPEYKNRFISNILSYYNKYGKLSEKQVEKCFELI